MNRLKNAAKTCITSLCSHSTFLDNLRKHIRPNTSDLESLKKHKLLESSLYFKSLRDRYAGRRGFVIGNGPSLQLDDLERIDDDITIASNKIYLAFDQVKWRPSFYTVADPLVWEKVKYILHRYVDVVHVPSYLPLKYEFKKMPKIWVWNFLFENHGNRLPLQHDLTADEPIISIDGFSANACDGFYGSSTVTFENLQFAMHLGLSPIYLIGCDHFYAGESNVTEGKVITVGNEVNHFMEGYRSKGETVNPAPLDLMERGYTRARLYAERNGIEVYNATRGGHLEIFKRANLDDVLQT